ncbi:hypothetical protein GPECTOR_311g850 [Gonium pectorale]|uniref:Kinesin motor domain-containing protein n=1 Tax=Gonium pectorale TaxID=33097 RepID=A0A150FVU7_GONPE|nr:hypothetical protein GPECTOR_311g850 [Gonium pectorale]|eukprot:KXZ41707.1 hypothetical protein GPECTOR_311g850 [Gonium pectorale]
MPKSDVGAGGPSGDTAKDAFKESCSTLRFADRARSIANNPVVNASRDVRSILALKEREIARLRAMLAQMAAEQGTGEEGMAARRRRQG